MDVGTRQEAANEGRPAMKWVKHIRSKPMVRKGLIAGVAALLVYALFGFLALPPILKSVLSKSLTETLHRKAMLRDIRVNPFELSVSVRGSRSPSATPPEHGSPRRRSSRTFNWRR